MKPDFLKAVRWLDEAHNQLIAYLKVVNTPVHPEQQERYETIRQGLLIAHVLTESPSAAVVRVAYDESINNGGYCNCEEAEFIPMIGQWTINAIRDQIIKEAESIKP